MVQSRSDCLVLGVFRLQQQIISANNNNQQWRSKGCHIQFNSNVVHFSFQICIQMYFKIIKSTQKPEGTRKIFLTCDQNR